MMWRCIFFVAILPQARCSQDGSRTLNINVDINIDGEQLAESTLVESNLLETCTDEYAAIPHHTMCIEDSPRAVSSGVTEEEKQIILDEHNRLRAGVTPPPADMVYMVWDNKMAAIAQKWAKQCVVGHDPSDSRSVPGYGINMGQNVAGGYSTWVGAIRGWYNEVEQYRYGLVLEKYGEVGHYLQLVQNTTSRVGCGYAKCKDSRYKNYYVCNYAKGFANRRAFPYTEGEPCSACPNNCKNGLCDCQGKLCLNGGKLNPATCECKCKSIMIGPACETVNCNVTDKPYCGKSIPTDFCTKVPPSRYLCPYMCGLCGRRETENGGKSAAGPVFRSKHGCVFRGERPSKDRCAKYGLKGMDRDSCQSEGGNIYSCASCSTLIVKMRHCPVMCGYCDPPCKGKRCQNGGKLDTSSCSCKCFDGYSGGLCQKAPCGGRKCKNGGKLNTETCQCACPKQYTGRFCGTLRCGGRTCQNGGKMDYSTCKCACKSAYTGPNCGQGRCGGRECANGGKMQLNTCTCKCPKQYQGRYCKGLKCGGRTCSNGGTMNLNSCKCKCTPRYTGKYCNSFVCPQKDLWRCRKLTKADCKDDLNRKECPYMCGRCRNTQG